MQCLHWCQYPDNLRQPRPQCCLEKGSASILDRAIKSRHLYPVEVYIFPAQEYYCSRT